jgi:hypothetical protein
MKPQRLASGFVTLGALVVLADARSPARAEEAPEASTGAKAPDIAPRPWLYLDDPSLPAPMHVVALTRATYSRDPSPTRPFGANVSPPGATLEMGGEVGLLPRVSLTASGFGGGDQLGFGAIAGLRLEPFQGLWKSTHAIVSGGYLRELSGGDGAWLRLAITEDFARLRLGATVHGEHVFAGNRDAVDVLVMAGASYAIAGPLRGGIEYVAQDLEESLGDGAEGGVRQFLGPQMSVELLEKRMSIAGGPAFGIAPQSPPFTGRLSVAYVF